MRLPEGLMPGQHAKNLSAAQLAGAAPLSENSTVPRSSSDGGESQGKWLVAADQPRTYAVGGEEDARLAEGLLPEQEAGRIPAAKLPGANRASEQHVCLAR